jgi:hypothetical protein
LRHFYAIFGLGFWFLVDAEILRINLCGIIARFKDVLGQAVEGVLVFLAT